MAIPKILPTDITKLFSGMVHWIYRYIHNEKVQRVVNSESEHESFQRLHSFVRNTIIIAVLNKVMQIIETVAIIELFRTRKYICICDLGKLNSSKSKSLCINDQISHLALSATPPDAEHEVGRMRSLLFMPGVRNVCMRVSSETLCPADVTCVRCIKEIIERKGCSLGPKPIKIARVCVASKDICIHINKGYRSVGRESEKCRRICPLDCWSH